MDFAVSLRSELVKRENSGLLTFYVEDIQKADQATVATISKYDECVTTHPICVTRYERLVVQRMSTNF